MDDGATLGEDQLMRLRTASGHQLLLHDTNNTIYVGHADGTSWIEMTPDGWEWENTGGGGCPPEASIEDVLYLMMHCEKNQPMPLNRLAVK